MGSSASKTVERTLRDSQDFDAACDAVYEECLDLAQHAFPGVMTYQLSGAAARLHDRLALLPVVKRWAPPLPSQGQIDRAIQRIRREGDDGETLTLSLEEFRAFTLELFTDAIVSSARRTILRRASIGFAGIAGLGMVTRPRKEALGKVMAVYALGLAAFLTFSSSAAAAPPSPS